MLKYLKYIFIHKWFVFVAGLKTKAPLFRLIIHDWTKFLPREFFPYIDFFVKQKSNNVSFNIAWNHHQKRNKHHWQYWVLISDMGHKSASSKIQPLAIPDKYIKEMVADWAGAGRSITGEWDVKDWYYKNKDNIMLEAKTREKVETLLDSLQF